jgi:multiple sugar transport system permease protein
VTTTTVKTRSAADPSSTANSPAGAQRVTRGRKPFNAEKQRSTILTIALWACGAYFLFPLIWLVISSTKSTGDLFTTFGLWFGNTFALFQNIGDVLAYQDGIFLRWTANTALYAGVSAAGAALVATAAGYAFAKYSFPGGRAIISVILGAIMIPSTALAIPTYLMFASVKLTDTPLAVILPSLVSPFGVFLMLVYAASAVPKDLIEAGRIDGAGEFRIFWQVALRLLVPGVVTVFLFALVHTWNNYLLPLIMFNNSNLYPITVGLAQWQAQGAQSGYSQDLFSIVITGSFISIIPLIVAFLYLQRYWQTGLATGGLKG